MLATLSNLPKWLLALVAFCVLTGYADQVKCKTVGCQPATASAKADTVKEASKSAPVQDDEQDCHCQCHFTTPVFGEPATFYVGFVRVAATQPPAWIDNTPEAPCVDIEHPPQLA